MFPDRQIYLASRSPRRRELLKQIGIKFNLLLMRETLGRPIDVDEKPVIGESPTDYIYRIVRAKASEGYKRILQRKFPVLPVLVADTIVILDGTILGKPKDIRQITEHEIHRYLASNNFLDKAGAYAIQGLAAVFIVEISGSYSGVMGLPLYETAQLLEEVGIEIFA